MSALNISSFMWGIADDVLRNVYVRGKYRDVILPMTIIRRLDAVGFPKRSLPSPIETLSVLSVSQGVGKLCVWTLKSSPPRL